MGMYGYKGGKKEGRKYPTVKSVHEEFYKLHPGATKNADQSLGETPLVSLSTFRFVNNMTCNRTHKISLISAIINYEIQI